MTIHPNFENDCSKTKCFIKKSVFSSWCHSMTSLWRKCYISVKHYSRALIWYTTGYGHWNISKWPSWRSTSTWGANPEDQSRSLIKTTQLSAYRYTIYPLSLEIIWYKLWNICNFFWFWWLTFLWPWPLTVTFEILCIENHCIKEYTCRDWEQLLLKLWSRGRV